MIRDSLACQSTMPELCAITGNRRVTELARQVDTRRGHRVVSASSRRYFKADHLGRIIAMVADSTQRIARLTPLDAFLASFQSRVAAVMPRRTPLSQALGAVLAEDVQPPQCPPHPIALRDGFAVAAAEIADAGPYAPPFAPACARPRQCCANAGAECGAGDAFSLCGDGRLHGA